MLPPFPEDNNQSHTSSERLGGITMPGTVTTFLQSYGILDAASEHDFDCIVHIAARLTGCPIALVVMVDGDRQWCKARLGIGASETSRGHAFCAYTVTGSARLLVVNDAAADPRFNMDPMVMQPPVIRFYVGVSLVSPEGHPVGTLCVMDYQPKELDPDNLDGIKGLADVIMLSLEARRTIRNRQIISLEQKRQDLRFRQVVEATPSAIVLVNSRGRIEMVNAEAERVFGYTRAAMLGNAVEMLVPERFHSHHHGLCELFFSAPRSRPMGVGPDLYGLRADGSEFPLEIGLNPIEIDDGTMVLCAIVDISERKRQEDRFRQAVEAAPNAMVMTNTEARIEMVNTQAERMFGYTREELLGRPIELLVPARFRERHPGLRAAFVADPSPRPMGAGRDLYALRRDGSEFPVEIGLNPITTRDSTKVLAAIVDISDRKQKEDRIGVALKEKEILLREIHHRVKNNLQIVHSLLDLQLAQIPDPAARNMLRVSQSRVHSMALIHQTLYTSNDFARVDFGLFLGSLVPALIASYDVDSKRISVRIEVDPVRLPIDAAVPCGLVVNELISNAFKHAFGMRDHGEIKIALTSLAGNEFILSVSDDGIGIPDHVDIPGNGTLGLQLVGLLADQVGGTFTIHRSNPTRFAIRLTIEQ